MSDKKEIRLKAQGIRNSIPSVVRAQKSKKIHDNLEELSIFQNAEHILFYYTFGSEVDTIPLINRHIKDKNIYLPRLVGKNKFIALPFHNFDTLRKGVLEIPEPIIKEDIPLDVKQRGGEAIENYIESNLKYENKLDLIIVPGLAFNEDGNRIGMGKGFYDRYLSKLPHVPRIALAFEEQMLESIPKDTYDEPINIIITDENIHRI